MSNFPLTIVLDNGVKAEVNHVAGYSGRYIFNLTKPNNKVLYSFVYSTDASLPGLIGPDGQNAIQAFLKML